MLVICLVILIVLFAAGVPIYIAFALGGLSIMMWVIGMPLNQLAGMFFQSMDSFVLLAGPLFILAGNIMVKGGLAKPLTDLLYSFTARIPGGVAIATIIACTFIGALTGSTIATLAAVGIIMFPAMKGANYDDEYSCGVLCAAANLGNLIPPSLAFILFGYLTETSVAKLFMAGIIPGLILAVILSITAIIIGKMRGFVGSGGVEWKVRGRLFIKGIPALMMPFIILGGIYGGLFTPTEAAAVACVYGTIVGTLIFRKMNMGVFWSCVRNTSRLVSIILMLIAGAMLLGKAYTVLGFPQAISRWVIDVGLGPFGFLFLFVTMYAVLGCVMEGLALMFVTIPLIFPAAVVLNIDPMQLGVIYCVSVLMAGMTPPISIFVYATAGMFGVEVEKVTRGVLPFLLGTFVTLLLFVLFPEISTWLPRTILVER